MTTDLAFALAFVALCSPALGDPALADPAPRAAAFKLRVNIHDGEDYRFRVAVGPRLPCATATRSDGDHRIEFKACVPDDGHLQIEWATRRGPASASGTSTVPLEVGTSVTLGSDQDTRIDVAIQ